MSDLRVVALYKFVALPDYVERQDPLRELCLRHDVCGTLLLAHEGINGTIAGPDAGIEAVLAELLADPVFDGLEIKESRASERPFRRMKVRLKNEIVTMGVEGIDPACAAGTYVDAADWNALLDDPEVELIDTRNEYEVAIGTFEGARNPGLDNFRQFPDWWQSEYGERPPRKVAMFCTGGIRCEKSTAFLRGLGLDQVFHLKGGILKYLEEVPQADSKWQGECFVFDERVAVGHGLAQGAYTLCRACRFPISAEDRELPSFVDAVSCRHCVDRSTPEQKARFAERKRQVDLAAARGEDHLEARSNRPN